MTPRPTPAYDPNNSVIVLEVLHTFSGIAWEIGMLDLVGATTSKDEAHSGQAARSSRHSARSVVYEPDDHALHVIVGGKRMGRIITQIGGYAYLPAGFHPLRYSSNTLSQVMASIDEEFEGYQPSQRPECRSRDT